MIDIIDVEISELGKTITGKTPSSKNPEDFGEEFMFVTPSDNWETKKIGRTERYVSEIGINKLLKKALPPNSVMVSCIGSAMGKVLMNKSKCLTNQQINSIVVNEKKFNADYIYYVLINNYKLLRAAGTGSTSLPLLNKTDFDALKLKVHKDRKIQKQIAKVLSDLDAKIEVNNKINQELEAMAKTLYDYWFVQFDFPTSARYAATVGKPDIEGKPYKSSGGKMVFNEELKREIPEGWEVKKVTKEMDVQYGFPFSTQLFNEEELGKPVIRIRDILNNTISLYSTEDIHSKYRLEKNDLLIGMDGNFHMNFWDKENCYLNQRSVRIRQKGNQSVSTFQAFFDTQPYIKAREKYVSRTTVGHLSARDINDLKVLHPTQEVRLKSNDFFNSVLNKIILNRNENQKLAELRDWLLPMLMNGQVIVGEEEDNMEVENKVKLEFAAEPPIPYGNESKLSDLFPSKDLYSEIACMLSIEKEMHGKSRGKTWIQKTANHLKELKKEPKLKNVSFEEYHWGMFSQTIAKSIDSNPFLALDDLAGLKVYKIRSNKIVELNRWMQEPRNANFVASARDIVSLYDDPLINNDLNRIELLNTVYRCIQKLGTTDFEPIYQAMREWGMQEQGFANKAEKFKPYETKLMIGFIKNEILK